MSKFQRLVRFEDLQGTVHYGELGSSNVDESGYPGLELNTYEGSTPWSEDFHSTGKKAIIAKVSTLLPYPEDVTG
jgi:hypothetical protein